MNNNWDRELIAIIKPDGEYELDWQYLEGLSPDVQASQENIYTEYLADCNYAWWSLGTSKINHYFSESMQYLHKVAAIFVKNLVRTSGLELLREQVVVTLTDQDLELLLEEFPI